MCWLRQFHRAGSEGNRSVTGRVRVEKEYCKGESISVPECLFGKILMTSAENLCDQRASGQVFWRFREILRSRPCGQAGKPGHHDNHIRSVGTPGCGVIQDFEHRPDISVRSDRSSRGVHAGLWRGNVKFDKSHPTRAFCSFCCLLCCIGRVHQQLQYADCGNCERLT